MLFSPCSVQIVISIRVKLIHGVIALLAHNFEKFIEGDVSITSLVRLINHLVQFFVSKGFTNLLANFLESLKVNFASFVLIKE